MRITDNPFQKWSYGDSKTWRNCLEVSACAMAAEKLNIPHGIVNAASHAWYLDVEVEDLEDKALYQVRILVEAQKIKAATVQEQAEELYLLS